MNKEEKEQICKSLIEDNLTSIVFSRNITKIRNCCFYDCKSLQSISFEEPCQITKIPNHCFRYCSKLSSVTIPSSITNIEYSSFEGCSSLQSITIPNTVTRLGMYCFFQCPKLTSVTFEEPCQITELPYSCFSNQYYSTPNLLTSITIPNSVKILGQNCFYNCGLTSINIPSSVTNIGNNCFAECPNLTTIYIDKPTDSIAGSPWGAENATVIWNDTVIKNYIVGTTEMLAGSSSYLPVSYVYPENGWKKGVTYTIKLLSLPTNSGSISNQTLSVCQIDNSSSMTYTKLVSNVALSSYIGQSWTWTPDKDYYGMPTGIIVSEYPVAGVCVATQQANNHIIAEVEISW